MAGKIPKEFITRLAHSADIADVVGSRIQLQAAGSSYKALCPFHKEKTPSFHVNPQRQMYYCFGCQAGGDALRFLMEYEKLDFVTAVESLAESLGMEVPREEGHSQQDSDIPEIRKLLEEAAVFYQEQLRTGACGKKAAAYLKQRGLAGRTAKHFGIGCAPDSWNALLKALGRGEPQRIALLKKAGLVTSKEGKPEKIYDRLRNRIVFPIRDIRGRVVGFGGRVLAEGDEGQPKYINSPETPVFHKRRILYGLYEMQQTLRAEQQKKPEYLLLVEGYMDVAMLAQHGICNAAATLGTALGAEHLELAYRQAPGVTLCFDGDAAGCRAAERALEPTLSTMQDGREVRFLFLDEGEDPDSLVRARSKEYFQGLLQEKSQPLHAVLLERPGQETEPQSPESLARLCRKVQPLVSLLPPKAGIYRRLLVQELAQRTGLTAEAMEAELKAMEQQGRRPPPEGAPRPQSPAFAHSPESMPPPPPSEYPPEFMPPPRQDTETTKAYTVSSAPTKAERAIALLLHHSSPGKLPLDGLARPPAQAGGDVLQELLLHLQQRPAAAAGGILARYEDTPWLSALEALSRLHTPQKDEAIEQELCAISESFARTAAENAVETPALEGEISNQSSTVRESMLRRMHKKHSLSKKAATSG